MNYKFSYMYLIDNSTSYLPVTIIIINIICIADVAIDIYSHVERKSTN